MVSTGWKFFFSSAWGRFEHRFSGLLESMTRLSDLIDREAVALDISQAAEWRKTEAENAHQRERQRHAEQLQAVLDWLETTNGDQEMKLEWLRSRCYEGTSSWITNNHKFRTWLQRGRGNSVLWLHGKPGSGIYSHINSFQLLPRRHLTIIDREISTELAGHTLPPQ